MLQFHNNKHIEVSKGTLDMSCYQRRGNRPPYPPIGGGPTSKGPQELQGKKKLGVTK